MDLLGEKKIIYLVYSKRILTYGFLNLRKSLDRGSCPNLNRI